MQLNGSCITKESTPIQVMTNRSCIPGVPCLACWQLDWSQYPLSSNYSLLFFINMEKYLWILQIAVFPVPGKSSPVWSTAAFQSFWPSHPETLLMLGFWGFPTPCGLGGLCPQPVSHNGAGFTHTCYACYWRRLPHSDKLPASTRGPIFPSATYGCQKGPAMTSNLHPQCIFLQR